jgi:hypothetical protein
MIDQFFGELARAIEQEPGLMRGAVFLPEYLKGKRLSATGFRAIATAVGGALGMEVREQYRNEFPPEYETGYHRQFVDYAYLVNDVPQVFLELESLDRAQLYLFSDPPVDPEKNSLNKLWYYYVTLGERYRGELAGPLYFAFLLILPDESVGHYQIWDSKKDYGFFEASMESVVRQSPFRFYDRRIKVSAREFLDREQEFPEPPGLAEWTRKRPKDLGHLCELVMFTATRTELIMSRGRNLFAPECERRLALNWRD